VADRLVQQDAGAAGRHDHWELAGRRGAGVERLHGAVDGQADEGAPGASAV
jgi:hypothetical protein